MSVDALNCSSAVSLPQITPSSAYANNHCLFGVIWLANQTLSSSSLGLGEVNFFTFHFLSAIAQLLAERFHKIIQPLFVTLFHRQALAISNDYPFFFAETHLRTHPFEPT